MKFVKKILLVLLIVVVAAQIPFIYRRYQIGKLAEKINQLQDGGINLPNSDFKEYKGIIHAHTSLGGHSTGSFEELISAANANGLDFVLMTEHHNAMFDSAALTLNGFYGKTLFVGGNELDTADGDRFLLIPGSGDAAAAKTVGTAAFLEKTRAENKLALVTYPERFKSWDSNFDGIEVFSLHTNAKQMNPLTALGDLIWSYPAYPELTLASHFKRPDANLRKFDEIASQRKISLFAGTDAHSNIGFHLFGDEAGNKLINIKLDPYETILRLARQHVLIENDKPLTRESLIEALRAGRAFIGFDVLGDTTGFSFYAENVQEKRAMGDEIPGSSGWKLVAAAPQFGHFAFFRNGEKFFDTRSDSVRYKDHAVDAREPGAYRVEVYRNDLGAPFDKMPWIISNPIYVR